MAKAIFLIQQSGPAPPLTEGLTAAPAGIGGDPKSSAAWLLSQESELPHSTAHKSVQVPIGGAEDRVIATQKKEGRGTKDKKSQNQDTVGTDCSAGFGLPKLLGQELDSKTLKLRSEQDFPMASDSTEKKSQSTCKWGHDASRRSMVPWPSASRSEVTPTLQSGKLEDANNLAAGTRRSALNVKDLLNSKALQNW
ncbi:hypothetical protein A6R68_00907 [Neotoma lepida]|uniref:Uncharacterized protein n=1 Tax=Neotoma lepida TaxID=56216 RepID=A0A1A6GW40_NEOLE|nr:hypothetical protein A6R68_00907 [Neotoma lepida]